MIRSMSSAISGLRNHQTMLDVVGNNISNINTAGFKSSAVVFQDVLSQALRGAGAGTEELGGTNPAQIGLGSRVGSITTNFSQGALQRTGRPTDVAIQGDGFFIVEQAGQVLYTRAGSFSIDAAGRLVTQDGSLVQGWPADAIGTVNTNGPVDGLIVPVGDLIAPRATGSVTVGGNLPADAVVGTTIVTSAAIYDNQGGPFPLSLSFEKTADDEWTVSATYGDPPQDITLTNAELEFDVNGELVVPAGYELTIAAGEIPGLGEVAIALGAAGASNRITQFGQLSTVALLDQDGWAAGSLQSFTVSQEGLLVGSYSNGRTRPIGQLALAVFANPEGLEKVGGSAYRMTVNSGLPQVGAPGAAGRGMISTGTLEMSNVDLAQEFTSLIVAQRGFQANSRVVTTSDELLNEVVNIKR